jgi:hypothetical protein
MTEIENKNLSILDSSTFVMQKSLILFMIAVTMTVTAGILMMASTVGTAQAVGCHKHFQNQGADCTDGVLCVHQTGDCRQTGPP